jgi:hypothetical protein
MTQTTVAEAQQANLSPNSFLSKVIANEPLRNSKGAELIRHVPAKRWLPASQSWHKTMAVLGCIDNGNDALKLAMPMADEPALATLRVPTAYAPSKEIRGGDGRLTWQVNNGEGFWIGDDALATKKADALPVGLSHERLPQIRYQHFLAACQVEMLIKAGQCACDDQERLKENQGEIDIYTTFGLPPEEVDRTGATPLAKTALQKNLLQKQFTVRRVDEDGRVSNWVIRFVELIPFGQTFGSFAAWYYTLDGNPIATDIERHVTLDIGGGQFHACEVEIETRPGWPRPKLHMTASQIGTGTVEIARGVSETVRKRYSNIQLSDAEAQLVLTTKTIPVGGRRAPVEQMVKDVIATRAEFYLTLMLKYLQDGQSFLMFTGGGSVLLYDTLFQMVNDHRKPQDFLFVPSHISAVLNAIGGIVLAQASAQRAISQQQQ